MYLFSARHYNILFQEKYSRMMTTFLFFFVSSLIFVSIESHFVNITILQRAVAKGAGDFPLLFSFCSFYFDFFFSFLLLAEEWFSICVYSLYRFFKLFRMFLDLCVLQTHRAVNKHTQFVLGSINLLMYVFVHIIY